MNRSRALLKAAMWADTMKKISGDVGFRSSYPTEEAAAEFHMWEEMAQIFREMAREVDAASMPATTEEKALSSETGK